jgi:flagellar hook-associated protein 2
MAVSSTSSSNTSSIDVAAIVEQLMKVENKPLEVLSGRIDQQKLVISDLGTIQSKVASLQDALKDFENPTSFNTVNAGTSNNKVLTATGTSGAQLGNYTIDVNMLASADTFNIGGYGSANATVDVNNFSLTVGDENFVWSPTASPNLSSLVAWINSRDVNVYARVVQTTSSNDYALQIFGTKTGTDNAFTFSGLRIGIPPVEVVPTDESIHTSVAADAEFTVNGVAFQRSNNSVTGVIDGVTLNLISTSATGESEVVSVSRGTDSSETVIKKLIDSYNDLMSTYKSMTANSVNSDKPGTFANNPMMLSFINEIKAKFATGANYGVSQEKSISLSAMGIDLQRDGTLKFNSLNFFSAQSDGLQSKLSEGVSIGYVSTSNNLKKYLSDLIGATGNSGSLATLIRSESTQITGLNKRQLDLQDRLASVQNSLISQYSALNALLYQLSQTNNALTSALDAISNNSKN